MNLQDIPTEDLERELHRRKNLTGTYTIISIDYSGPTYNRSLMHIIENNGSGEQQRVNLMECVSDDTLMNKEPQIRDGEPGYDQAWEDFEEFKAGYLVGKEMIVETFEPYLRAKLK